MLYLYFKKYYDNALKVIEDEKKKHSFRNIFHYNETLMFTAIILAGIFDAFYWFLLFFGVYGWVYYFAMLFVLTKKSVRFNKKMSKKEGYYSK